MNVKFHKNCDYTGKILKISCVRCNSVKFDIHFLGLPWEMFFCVTTDDLLHLCPWKMYVRMQSALNYSGTIFLSTESQNKRDMMSSVTWSKRFECFSSFLKHLSFHKLASFWCFSQQFCTLYRLWVIIIPFSKQNQTKTEPEV